MRNNVRELLLVALFPAMMAATAGIAIPISAAIPFAPAITLQTLFVYLAGLMLKPRDAAISMSVYVLLGMIGVPVFAGFRSGAAVLLTASGGFIIGFIVIAFCISLLKNSQFIKIIKNIYLETFTILVLGTIGLYMIGGAYIAYLYDMSFWLVLVGFWIYLIGDFLKIFVAINAYVSIRSHIMLKT